MLTEMLMGQRNQLFGCALTNKISKSMSVLHWCGHLDAATYVVVSVTQLVGQQLDVLRRIADRIMHNSVVSWRNDSLSRCLTHQEEFISVFADNIFVDDGTWQRVDDARF